MTFSKSLRKRKTLKRKTLKRKSRKGGAAASNEDKKVTLANKAITLITKERPSYIQESKIQELKVLLADQMKSDDIKLFERYTADGSNPFFNEQYVVELIRKSYSSIYAKIMELRKSVVQSW